MHKVVLLTNLDRWKFGEQLEMGKINRNFVTLPTANAERPVLMESTPRPIKFRNFYLKRSIRNMFQQVSFS